jgi:hypothetical protein
MNAEELLIEPVDDDYGYGGLPKPLPTLNVVVLSEMAKLMLLQNPARQLRSCRADTSRIYAQLQKLHPPTSQDFALRDSGVTSAPFRLLCETSDKVGLSQGYQSDSFIAVSYCWHNDDWVPAHSLGLLKDKPMEWPISEMMLREVLDLRLNRFEGLWIDSLCIRQSDLSEKKLAISSMDVIYERARLVVMLLEDVLLTNQELQAVLEVMGYDSEDERSIEPSEINHSVFASLVPGVTKIARARWFTRSWCSHELQMSKESLFIIPADSCILRISISNLRELAYHAERYCTTYDGYEMQRSAIKTTFDTLSRVEREHIRVLPPPGFSRPLMSLFHDIFQLSCSNIEDKISIALNVTGIQLRYLRDRPSEALCQWTLSLLALAAGDATVLGGLTNIQLNPGQELASWLTWTDDLEDSLVTGGSARVSDSYGITELGHNHITLDLLFLHDYKPKTPSRESILRAGAFFDECYLDITFGSELSMDEIDPLMTGDPKYQEVVMRRVAALACSLECGLDWMTMQGSQCQRLYARLERLGLKGKEDDRAYRALLETANTLFDQTSTDLSIINNDRDRMEELFEYLLFLMYSPPKFCTTAFRQQPFHPDSEVQERVQGRHWHMAYADLGLDQKGLTLEWTGPSRSNIGKIVWAIPTALQNPTCATIRRIWGLRLLGSSKKPIWRIVSKVVLFTFLAVVEDGEAVVLERRQRIDGFMDGGKSA